MAHSTGMTGRKHSEETKQKMRLKALGNQNAKGQKISDAHKKLLSELKQGQKNPNWKGGIYVTNNAIRRSPQYKRWQKEIYSRDSFTCQICGSVGKKLRANHIKKFSDFPELRFEVTNGITICESCDYLWVFRREEEWESYFNFNLKAREVI